MNSPFQVVQPEIKEVFADPSVNNVVEQIKKIIDSDNIVLFMKGNADFPQCGFSANTVAILKHLGASFNTFNILNNQEIRNGLKEYSNWPTYPQLYWKGKLLGGNDIVTEMFESGDLKNILNEK